jgi:LysR family glycine cleavage system transcriptional activator
MALRPTVLPAFGVFAAAARHQNFAHAADELHLTASAVSHHVRRLEATLGVTLFQRHARGVSLTAEGRVLADAAGNAFADLDAAFGSLQTGGSGTARVRITTLHSLTYCWLLPRLPRFTAAHPNIFLSIETNMSLARFDEGGPDLGIRHGAGHWPGLTAYHLMGDALFPVASPRLPGVADVTTPAHIARLPLVADLGLQGWRDWFRFAGVRGVRLPAMHSFSDSTDALLAAACGLGAALGRAHIVEPYLSRGELVRLPGPALKARFGYYAVHPGHKQPSAATAAFIDWVRREALQSDAGSSAAPAATKASIEPKRLRRPASRQSRARPHRSQRS